MSRDIRDFFLDCKIMLDLEEKQKKKIIINKRGRKLGNHPKIIKLKPLKILRASKKKIKISKITFQTNF